MRKVLMAFALILTSSLFINAQEIATNPKFIIFTDLSSHFKGNQALNLGFQRNFGTTSIAAEANYYYGYSFSNSEASAKKNNTKLNTADRNLGLAVTYKKVFADKSSFNTIKQFYLGGKLGLNKLNYVHTQLIPNNVYSAETPQDVCNCTEKEANLYSTSNTRTDAMVQFGYQSVLKNGLFYDLSLGTGLAMNFADITSGSNYTNNYCAITDTYNYTQNKGNTWEKNMTLNNNGAPGFSPLFLTQVSIKIGWATSRPKN